MPPRSRSPTPAVDDEDYHVVGDESYHYTGESQDPEKGEYVDAYHGQPIIRQNTTATIQSRCQSRNPYTLQLANPTQHLWKRAISVPHQRSHRAPASEKDCCFEEWSSRHRSPRFHLNLFSHGEDPQRPRSHRYSAVTCDPDDFARSGYSLRQFESKRTTEIFIVITMYNVSRMSGVQAFVMTPWNFRKMKFYSAEHCMGSCGIYLSCARAKNSKTWGRNGCRK